MRPGGLDTAALTDVGSAIVWSQVTAQPALFRRKSSVWVAHRRSGPGKLSRITDAAARRSHVSTRHLSDGSKLVLPRPLQEATPRPGLPSRTYWVSAYGHEGAIRHGPAFPALPFTPEWCSVGLPSTVRVPRMAADLVGLCRRCRSLPRSAWCDPCPFKLFAVYGTSRVFGPSLFHAPPVMALCSPPAVRQLLAITIPSSAARAVVPVTRPSRIWTQSITPKRRGVVRQ